MIVEIRPSLDGKFCISIFGKDYVAENMAEVESILEKHQTALESACDSAIQTAIAFEHRRKTEAGKQVVKHKFNIGQKVFVIVCQTRYIPVPTEIIAIRNITANEILYYTQDMPISGTLENDIFSTEEDAQFECNKRNGEDK